LNANKFKLNLKKKKKNMIQFDAKSIENMLITSIIICDNDIEKQQKSKKKEIEN
jgi:hypothetical protein